MRKLFFTMILNGMILATSAQNHIPCGPVPTENQLRWQDM